MRQSEILTIIIDRIARLNEQLPEEERLNLTAETALWGGESGLDSLSLINLIVEIEEALQTRLGLRIEILEAGVMQDGAPQFATAEDLSRWIFERIKK